MPIKISAGVGNYTCFLTFYNYDLMLHNHKLHAFTTQQIEKNRCKQLCFFSLDLSQKTFLSIYHTQCSSVALHTGIIRDNYPLFDVALCLFGNCSSSNASIMVLQSLALFSFVLHSFKAPLLLCENCSACIMA